MPIQIYKREPLHVKEGIPVYSIENDYTNNYEKISRDHLDIYQKTGRNPFMDEEAWLESENSTAELIRKYSHEGQMILDVGVGMGRLLSSFENYHRYGMDISFGYLKLAEQKSITVCYSQIEDMPYKENIFDIIVCTDVLEHVIDLNHCIGMILSVLKKNGILIIRVPYKESLKGYLSPDFPYRFCHLRNFDEFSARILFERVFSCEIIEYYKTSYYLKNGISRFLKLFRKQVWRMCKSIKFTREMLCYPAEINFVFKKQS